MGHVGQPYLPSPPSGGKATGVGRLSQEMAEAGFNKIAYLLERFAQAIGAHDRENPDHHSWGIGMAHYDIERLGLEEGEQILPGIVLQADGGVTGGFRVLCDGEHNREQEEAEEEIVEAVAQEARELEVVRPGGGHEDDEQYPPPLRPPL